MRNTQLHVSFNPADNTSEAAAVTAIGNSVRDVREWIRNDNKQLMNEAEYLTKNYGDRGGRYLSRS